MGAVLEVSLAFSPLFTRTRHTTPAQKRRIEDFGVLPQEIMTGIVNGATVLTSVREMMADNDCHNYEYS